MLIHSAEITGSVQFNNTDVSGITNVSSFATTASVDALVVKTGSYASTSSVNELQSKTGSYASTSSVNDLQSKTGSYTSTSSFGTYTASNDLTNATQSTRLSTIESVTGSFTSTSSFGAYSSSINTFTSSATTRLNTIESVTGSFASTSSVNNLQSVTGSYASTGSNQFNGDTTITGSLTISGNNKISFPNSKIRIGSDAIATGTNVIAIGFNPSATGNNSIAIGYAPKTEIDGIFNSPNSNDSIAIGYNPFAGGNNSIAIGYSAKTSFANSINIGDVFFSTGSFGSSKAWVSGSFGIGTSSPDFKLDVNGTTRLNGNTTVTGSIDVSGSITSNGTITAQTLVVQTVTSSIEFITGSTRNGSIAGNTHQFTGSVLMSGSVGIGRAPEFTLDVNGDIAFNRTNKLMFAGPTIGDRSRSYLIGDGNNNIFVYGPSSNLIATFAYTGYTSLSGYLDIQGNSVITSANDKFALGVSGSSYAWIQSFGGRSLVLQGAGNNVGIGASTSPTYKLEVSTAGGSERIRVGTLQNNSNTATFEAITSSTISTATSGWIRAVYGGGLALGTSTYTKAGGDSGNFANLSAEVQTVAMTINGGGVDLNNPTTIGKNTNAGSCIGFTENQIYRTGNGVLYLQEYSTNHLIALNGGGNFLIGTSTNLGYKLFANGTAAGLSNWNNVSDGRLKKDVTPVINGLDKIKQLNGITFNWDKTLRPDLNVDDKNHLGLIAQDVEAILPQVVTTGEDEFGTKTIAYSDIVPVLIEAIKELSAEITILKQK